MNGSGQVVLVTGGATGIGLAIAERFHHAGNCVVLVGRRKAVLDQATAALPGVTTCVADITDATDRERLVRAFPNVTVLVNNAGIQTNLQFADTTSADIEYEFRVNLLAPVLLTRAFLPLLLQRPQAAVVNVSSGLALVPKQGAAVYCAAKAALHSFSITLRWQLEATAVKVFEVLPPLVETAMTAGRGKWKISPQQLADEVWRGFLADREEMLIGKTRLLQFVNRVAPGLAKNIMRPGF